MSFRKKLIALFLVVSIALPKPAKADFWGGDIPLLIKIVANTIEQLIVLKQIFRTGADSLTLMRDINSGIREGLQIIRIINPKFNPGLYGSLERADEIQRIIEQLYGVIPNTSEHRLQEAQDRSVAESIAMNGTLFRFADEVDLETKRIVSHAKVVSPQGAGKLTAESLAILIGVTTQVLRTNSMMLKMLGQNMALSNRKEKLQSAQFRAQYEGVSSALGKLPKETTLQPLDGSIGR